MPRNATHSEQQHHVLFGSTSFADGIPQAYLPEASCGPVFFEGFLVLDMSFQKPQQNTRMVPDCQEPRMPLASPFAKQEYVETLRLFDTQTGRLHPFPLEVRRFEYVDLVLFDDAVVWKGALDTSKPAVSSITEPCATFLSWKHFGRSQGYSCERENGADDALGLSIADKTKPANIAGVKHAEAACIEEAVGKTHGEAASTRPREGIRKKPQAKRRKRWGSELRSIFL